MENIENFKNEMDVLLYIAKSIDVLVKHLKERKKPRPVQSLYYSAKEAALRIGISIRSLRRMVANNEIKVYKRRRKCQFLKTDIDGSVEMVNKKEKVDL